MLQIKNWKIFNGRIDFIFFCLLVLMFIVDYRNEFVAGIKDAISFLLK